MQEQMWCPVHGWHSEYSPGLRCDVLDEGDTALCGLNVYDSDSPRVLVPLRAPWRYAGWRRDAGINALANVPIVLLFWGVSAGAVFAYAFITILQGAFLVPALMLFVDKYEAKVRRGRKV